MRNWSAWEKMCLALLCGFFLFSGGYFFGKNAAAQPVVITTQKAAENMVDLSGDVQEAGEETPQSLVEGETININTAIEKELQRLPGIGAGRAAAIVAWREKHGPFTVPGDLLQVDGIGEGILAGLIDYVKTED